MNIKLNGKDFALDAPLTVAQLAAQLALAPTQVAIERNRQIVPRSTYADVMVNAGDEIEIVSFIGGG